MLFTEGNRQWVLELVLPRARRGLCRCPGNKETGSCLSSPGCGGAGRNHLEGSEKVTLPVPLLHMDRPDLVGSTKGRWLEGSYYQAFGDLLCLPEDGLGGPPLPQWWFLPPFHLLALVSSPFSVFVIVVN